MSGKRKVLLVFVLLVIAAAIFVYREYNRTNANISGEAAAYTVHATELLNEFARDDSLASKKYVGKIISVTGQVKNLNQDERGLYTVSLGDSLSASAVRCSVDSMYTDRVASLLPGMEVNIKGNCTGFNVDELLGSDVIVNRCVIEKSNK